MLKLNKRQLKILDLIRSKSKITNKQIIDELVGVVDEVTRATIVSDLNKLIDQGLIIKKGYSSAVRYEEKLTNQTK